MFVYKAVNRESEILAEDDQVFLTRQQQILVAGGGLSPAIAGRVGESPLRGATLGKSSPRSPAASAIQGSPKKVSFRHVAGQQYYKLQLPIFK